MIYNSKVLRKIELSGIKGKPSVSTGIALYAISILPFLNEVYMILPCVLKVPSCLFIDSFSSCKRWKVSVVALSDMLFFESFTCLIATKSQGKEAL